MKAKRALFFVLLLLLLLLREGLFRDFFSGQTSSNLYMCVLLGTPENKNHIRIHMLKIKRNYIS